MKKSLSILAFVFMLFACKKDSFDIVNLNNNQITILGHAGMGIDKNYPMNSIESILKCLTLGVDGTEMDVQMTKDGVLVAYHDEFLETNTNLSGRIFEKTWDEINGGIFKYPPFTNYRVVRLIDIFNSIPNQASLTFSLDCKNYNPDTSNVYHQQFNAALLQVIDQFDLATRANIEFRRIDMILALQKERPELMLYVYSHFSRAMDVALQYQLKGIIMPLDGISNDEVALAHQSGIMVAVFNTHSNAKNIEAIRKNVDIIQTDKASHLVKTLK